MQALPLLVLSACLLSLSALSSEKSPYKGYIEADMLYWQTRADNLSLACASTSSTTLSQAQALHPHFEWDFGFRVGGGVLFPSNKWDLSLVVTALHNKAHRHVPPREGIFLFPQWLVPNEPPTGYADSGSLHWRLHLGLLDLALSYRVRCSEAFSFSPLLGLRGAIVRQKDNMIFSGGTLFPEGTDALSMKNKFFGLGPRAGVKAEWAPWRFLALFGSSSLSLAYGQLYLHQSEKASVGTTKRLSIRNIFQETRAVADMALGLESIWRTSKGPMELHISLAWEELFLFGQEQFMRFLDPDALAIFSMNQGDLFLQGTSFQLKWVF